MTCASCSGLIERESLKLPGIKSITVSYASESAIVETDSSNEFNQEMFKNLIENLGYRINMGDESVVDHSFTQAIVLLLFGSFLMSVMFIPIDIMKYHTYINLFQLIISGAILVYFGKHYFLNLIRFVRFFYSDMHTLIGVGIFSNYFFSLSLFLKNPHGHLYVEAIPFIMGFTKLGQYFEKQAKTKALTSMSSLYKMQIKFCKRIIEKNNQIENIPVIDLKLDEVIRILPGEKIPVNGVVVKGDSHLDESLLSGESKPRHISLNDQVIAGAINLEGSIDIKVSTLFNDSLIAGIIQKLEVAEKNKSQIEVLVDRVVRFFVPGILLIAFFTLLAWLTAGQSLSISMKYFIAVCVIACPCALGLAAPMAILIMTRKALTKGIMINGGEVIEIAQKIDTIVFDKTGTLTRGRPEVQSVVLDEQLGMQSDFVFSLIASMTALSSHPLSKSISDYFINKNVKILDPDKFKNLPGLGFEGLISNHKLILGNAKLLEQNNILMPEAKFPIGSLVFFAIDNHYGGFFVIKDSIKPESFLLLDNLKKLNLEIWMLSGDNQQMAMEVANELKINNVIANVDPLQKTEFIKELKNKGKMVCMVGDGINDSIALKESHLSLAMSNGSDIAISASQVSLLNGDISVIDYFFKLSKQTVNIIRQNLFFSFLYNLLCVPLAAGLLVAPFQLELDPKWASLSMGLSSVSVIINSMRLKKG